MGITGVGWMVGSVLRRVHPGGRQALNKVVLTDVGTSLTWQAGAQGKGL